MRRPPPWLTFLQDLNSIVTLTTNGVVLSTPMPVMVGNITAGSSAPVTLHYLVPMGVTSFRTFNCVTSSDQVGNMYSYGAPPAA